MLIALLLAAALAVVNRDLFRFTCDMLIERTLSPETDPKRDYILTSPLTLKPGSYQLITEITAEKNGSALFIVDGGDTEIFTAELIYGTPDPVYPLEIRNLRLSGLKDFRSQLNIFSTRILC